MCVGGGEGGGGGGWEIAVPISGGVALDIQQKRYKDVCYGSPYTCVGCVCVGGEIAAPISGGAALDIQSRSATRTCVTGVSPYKRVSVVCCECVCGG